MAPTIKEGFGAAPTDSDSSTSPSSTQGNNVINAIDKIGDVLDMFS